MFIVQVFRGNKWADIKKRKSFELARGDAWHMSLQKDANYGGLTRVIVRNENVIVRFGQKDLK